MNKLTTAQWYRSLGPVRASLLFSAIAVKVLFYIFNPPYYISKKALILPFHFLIALDIAWAVVTGIIIIECLRVIAHRSTSSWSLKRHFIVVFVLIILLALIIPIKNSKYYYSYGWDLTEEKDYEQAKLSLDLAIKYNPKKINAYLERAYVHRELGDFASAQKDYDKVVGMDPKNANGYEGKGYVYYYMGDYNNALKEWETAIALDPQRANRLDKWIKATKN